MSLIRVVTQGGPGGVLLMLYVIGSGYIWTGTVDNRVVIFVAVLAGFVLPLYISLDSDRTIRFIAYPIIAEAKREIDQNKGNEDFYHGHPDKQDKLDDYDEKTYQHTVLVYVGALIVITALIQAIIIESTTYTAAGLLTAFVGGVIVYLSFQNLRKAINTSPRLYK